ncbi:unnamed protein product [Miscanthus lutarioriparius]|uniref:dCMP deaminase n=1 Tax=Miscanthus lutarioriparius TaxID=422564 RepID=A0A811NRP4_9POAL|nr:unnamed protein product [Miscanthus lutarioriparius]
MASTRDLAIASLSAAAGAVAAAAALRLLSCRRTSSVRPQNLSLAANGSASERLLAQWPFDPAKREGYISWDDYFMAIAFLSAERSKDPNRQVGACLVSQEGIILGIGYNGFPRGCSDDKLPWAKKSANGNPLETKFPARYLLVLAPVISDNGSVAAFSVADSLTPDTPNICCITVVVPNDTRFDTNSRAWLSNKSKPEARKLATWKAKLSDTLAISITDRDQETNSLSFAASAYQSFSVQNRNNLLSDTPCPS